MWLVLLDETVTPRDQYVNDHCCLCALLESRGQTSFKGPSREAVKEVSFVQLYAALGPAEFPHPRFR